MASVKAAVVAMAFLFAGAEGRCEMFDAMMQTLPGCMTTGKLALASCNTTCRTLASGVQNTANGKDCPERSPCAVSGGCDPVACSIATTHQLKVREAHKPFSSDVREKCQDASGKTEIALPCLAPGERVYYTVDVFEVSGFQYEVQTENGEPTGLMELFSVTDSENDEIFDCFALNTTDDATCHNSFISRGLEFPPPLVLNPTMKIIFGFMGCSPAPTCSNAFLTFRTSKRKTPGVHGCTSPITKFTGQIPDDKVCREGAAGLAPTLLLSLCLALALLL